MWGTAVKIRSRKVCIRFIPTHVGNGLRRRVVMTPIAVHPHACGERVDQWFWLGKGGGSSPRMWGTARLIRVGNKQARFIPTHVGDGAMTIGRMT